MTKNKDWHKEVEKYYFHKMFYEDGEFDWFYTFESPEDCKHSLVNFLEHATCEAYERGRREACEDILEDLKFNSCTCSKRIKSKYLTNKDD